MAWDVSRLLAERIELRAKIEQLRKENEECLSALRRLYCFADWSTSEGRRKSVEAFRTVGEILNKYDSEEE